ncbi:hypothetical protein MTO96_013659 [Rhipicephalus appendiculatus]
MSAHKRASFAQWSDATAKPEPGILEGAFSSIGSQTECLKANAFLNMSGKDAFQRPWHVDHVQGSFCKIRYRLGLRDMLDAIEQGRASANMLDLVDGVLGEDRYLLGGNRERCGRLPRILWNVRAIILLAKGPTINLQFQ